MFIIIAMWVSFLYMHSNYWVVHNTLPQLLKMMSLFHCLLFGGQSYVGVLDSRYIEFNFERAGNKLSMTTGKRYVLEYSEVFS